MDVKSCHICNIYLPSGYITIHEQSKLHKINLKIANIANERLIKQANVNYVVHEQIYDDDVNTYFCDVCVSVVEVHQLVHNDSEMHKKNKTNIDNLVAAFKTYNDENLIEDAYQSPNEEYITFLKSVHNVEHLEAIDDEIIVVTAKNGDKVKVKERDFHSITTCFTKTYMSSYTEDRCMLCLEKIGTLKDHIVELQHIMKIREPVADKNCMREVDESRFSYCMLCAVRVSYLQVTLHINTDEHKHNLRMALISENKEISENNADVIGAESKIDDAPNADSVCNTDSTLTTDSSQTADYATSLDKASAVDNARDAAVSTTEDFFEMMTYIELQKYMAHIEMLHPVTHSVELFMGVSYLKIIAGNGNGVMLPEKKFFGITSSHFMGKTRFACRFCRESFIDSARQHVYSEDHIGYISTNIMDEHCIRYKHHKDKGSEAFCLHCERYFIESVKEHKTSQKHKDRMNEVTVYTINYTPKLNYEVIDNWKDKKLLCRICEVPVPNDVRTLRTHATGSKHVHKKQQFMLKHQLKCYLTDYECLKCKSFVLARDVHEHLESH